MIPSIKRSGGKFFGATVGRMIERTAPTANPEGGHRRKAIAAA